MKILSTISQYLPSIFVSLIGLALFFLDHFELDRNTTLYKKLRWAILILILLSVIANVAYVHFDNREKEALTKSLLEAKNERADIKDLVEYSIADKQNPRLTDGGKLSIEIRFKASSANGILLDLLDPQFLNQNRIFLSISSGNLLKLFLYDSDGNKYSVQGSIEPIIINQPYKFECLWSKKYRYIGISYNGELLARRSIPDFTFNVPKNSNFVVEFAKIDVPGTVAGLEMYYEKSHREGIDFRMKRASE